MVDLVHLWSKLIDQKHHCLVPGFYDDVEPLGDGETDIYDRIDFDVNDFKKVMEFTIALVRMRILSK